MFTQALFPEVSTKVSIGSGLGKPHNGLAIIVIFGFWFVMCMVNCKSIEDNGFLRE